MDNQPVYIDPVQTEESLIIMCKAISYDILLQVWLCISLVRFNYKYDKLFSILSSLFFKSRRHFLIYMFYKS